jgi:hypothetical protein
MSDLTRLERIAQELVVRVRDDDPEANARWLLAHADEADRWKLLFILAAAVPDDRRWTELTEWYTGGAQERRRAQWRESKQRSAA